MGRENALFSARVHLNGQGEDIGDISMIRHENARHGVKADGVLVSREEPALLRRGCQYLNAIIYHQEKLMRQLQPDTLIKKPQGEPLVSSVVTACSAASLWQVVGRSRV